MLVPGRGTSGLAGRLEKRSHACLEAPGGSQPGYLQSQLLSGRATNSAPWNS